MASGRRARAQQGFVYIALLIGVAMLAVGLGATSEVWTLTRQREKEQELLFVGNQFRQAITRFYLQSPPAARRFPLSLEELLEDTRTPDKPQRFLRKLYTDPMTRSTQWGEVRLASGQLVGVYSQSRDTPLKSFGFARRDKAMEEKAQYAEWVFRSPLPAANPLLAAGAGYTGPGGSAGATAPLNPAPPPVPRTNNTATPPGFVQPMPRPR
jgi:type II secretory pathway pseudopilin PulG